MAKGTVQGGQEPDRVLGGEQDRSSEGQQKEWKQATSGIRRLGEGALQNAPETWEVSSSQDSKGRTLDEMTNNRERELIESTYSLLDLDG